MTYQVYALFQGSRSVGQLGKLATFACYKRISEKTQMAVSGVTGLSYTKDQITCEYPGSVCKFITNWNQIKYVIKVLLVSVQIPM